VNKSYKFPFAELRSAFKKNPLRVVNSTESVFNHLKNGHGIAFAEDDSLLHFEYLKRCGFDKLEAGAFLKDTHLIFK
jgi:hypothetical protein